MPRRCHTDPSFPALIQSQDEIVHRDQALDAGLTRRAIDYRLGTHEWSTLLPGVYLTRPGEAHRRQLLIAAVLFAGPESAIDGPDACRFHGIKSAPVDDSAVHVVLPWGTPIRSRGFVVVRRTIFPIPIVRTDRVRYVDAATAAIAASRLVGADRTALAIMSEVLQRRLTTYDELVRAHIQGQRRNARRGDAAIAYLGAGIRSTPEADFLRLVSASTVLPRPLLNPTLRLPGGRVVSPDALFVDAGLVHETNGRLAHERADLFEQMQQRHDLMTAAGLTILHNSPRRLVTHGREVIGEIEACYRQLAGRGLPRGVAVLSMAA